jgi:hypothetical protein
VLENEGREVGLSMRFPAGETADDNPTTNARQRKRVARGAGYFGSLKYHLDKYAAGKVRVWLIDELRMCQPRPEFVA